jgi:hypothetical protein
MSDKYEVDVEAIYAHAGDTTALMDHVRGAAEWSLLINPQTFGAIGLIWAAALTRWTDEATGFIEKAADGGDRIASELTNMAEAYENQEDENRQAYAEVLSRLDSDSPTVRQANDD